MDMTKIKNSLRSDERDMLTLALANLDNVLSLLAPKITTRVVRATEEGNFDGATEHTQAAQEVHDLRIALGHGMNELKFK